MLYCVCCATDPLLFKANFTRGRLVKGSLTLTLTRKKSKDARMSKKQERLEVTRTKRVKPVTKIPCYCFNQVKYINLCHLKGLGYFFAN